MNYDQVKEVAQRTGLRVEVCLELLNSGWAYVEEMGRWPRWERTN